MSDRLESVLSQAIDLLVDRIADRVIAKISERTDLLPPDPATVAAGKVMWREKEAAAAISVSYGWLKQQRTRGNIKASTDGKPVLYSRDDLDGVVRFLKEHGRNAVTSK